ncbi:MAG TPA: hypothetical protein VL091_14905 [Marinobacter sp.]|nr:hypothetical protein [Marinobacter sp.]
MRRILLILSLLTVGSVAIAAEPVTDKEEDNNVVTLRLKMNSSSNSAQASPINSRLKFKGRGPTCLCADGLSEKDILEQQLIRQSKKN